MTKTKSSTSAFITLVLVFFFWGFIAASNDILIPVFKDKLNLAQWQSQMVSFAFYVAYTVGSIIYILVSRATGGDLLNRMGYKNGIALGLVISAFGALLFYPAAMASSFALFITGLFIVGLGFSLQQTAANPLAINMGDAASGSQRLSLAGGINNVGTTLGPALVSYAIFGELKAGEKLTDLHSVQTPYLVVGAAFVFVALLIRFSSLPNQIHSSEETLKEIASGKDERSVFSYPQLVLGMIAIFVYVGVEVSTASNLPEFMKQHLGVDKEHVSPFVSLFWASLMIGRWTGASGAFNVSDTMKKVLGVVLPFAAFGVFIWVNGLFGIDMAPFYKYAAIIPVIIIGNMLTNGKPAWQLLLYSALGIIALIIGILSDGMISAFAFISVGLFCSTLWPCIFTLAITGLGRRTNDASSFLIMMIMGGGFISVLQGFLADKSLLGIQHSYVVGVLCFAYLAFYGWQMRQLKADHPVVPEIVE